MSKIPFPAITICTESKTNSDIFNLTHAIETVKSNKTLSKNDSSALEVLFGICEYDLAADRLNITKVNYARKFHAINHDFIDHCRIEVSSGGKRICSESQKLHEVVTGEGICYAYNMLDYRDLFTNNMSKDLRQPNHGQRSNWTVSGYPDNDPLAYPFRVMSPGRRAGLFLSLSMRKKDVDYACKGAVNGFRVTLHTPDETPRTASHFYRAPFNTETSIAITPRVISTSENLRSYKPAKRQCFFPGEKRLEFFKSYTQENCKSECVTGEFECSFPQQVLPINFVKLLC